MVEAARQSQQQGMSVCIGVYYRDTTTTTQVSDHALVKNFLAVACLIAKTERIDANSRGQGLC